MVHIIRMVGCLGLLALYLGIVSVSTAADNEAPRTHVDIGMPRTLFAGINEALIKLGAAPFRKMMKDQTGIDGAIHFPADAFELAELMKSGKVQIGVMQGHEFAWTKKNHLLPIAIAVPMQPVQSFCVVRWDCTAKNIGELKNGKISLPPIHRDYSEMFLAKQKQEHMKGANFAGQLSASTASEAIDDVINEKSECTFVDCTALKFYENVFPGAFKNVKVLCQSEVFPNACIVVKKGDLDQATIDKFKKALLNASNDATGRFLLGNWKLKNFDEVPADYDQQIKNIEKAYPLPPAVDK